MYIRLINYALIANEGAESMSKNGSLKFEPFANSKKKKKNRASLSLEVSFSRFLEKKLLPLV